MNTNAGNAEKNSRRFGERRTESPGMPRLQELVARKEVFSNSAAHNNGEAMPSLRQAPAASRFDVARSGRACGFRQFRKRRQWTKRNLLPSLISNGKKDL